MMNEASVRATPCVEKIHTNLCHHLDYHSKVSGTFITESSRWIPRDSSNEAGKSGLERTENRFQGVRRGLEFSVSPFSGSYEKISLAQSASFKI